MATNLIILSFKKIKLHLRPTINSFEAYRSPLIEKKTKATNVSRFVAIFKDIFAYINIFNNLYIITKP